MTNTPARNTISAREKGNHSQPVDEETALFLGDRTVSQAAWQPGAMVRLTVSGKARVFSG
ncbi:iron dicitrate ABC transporter ATP-binding protein [Klebsiella pneumoniae]|nr:hypothetical protein [Klebsiella pneumoniae]STV50829.1 iron dicitrate ABC transporter ATP-binding protein [Klebsiella pneumoniae]